MLNPNPNLQSSHWVKPRCSYIKKPSLQIRFLQGRNPLQVIGQIHKSATLQPNLNQGSTWSNLHKDEPQALIPTDVGKRGITRAKGSPNYPSHLAKVNTMEENTRNNNQKRKKREYFYWFTKISSYMPSCKALWVMANYKYIHIHRSNYKFALLVLLLQKLP